MRERIIAAFSANSFGFVTSIVIQLATLPIFIHFWGTEKYGKWLLINTIPSYITLLDFGLVQAASTQMMIGMGAKKLDAVNETFHTVIFYLGCSFSLLFLIFLSSIFIFDFSSIVDQSLMAVMVIMVLCAIVGHLSGLTNSIFFATHRYATATYLNNCARLFEWLMSIVALYIWGTIISVALSMLTSRLISSFFLYLIANRNRMGISWGVKYASKQRLRELIKPGLSFMSFTLNDVINLQGVLLVVGMVSGPAAVTILNAYRTFSRLTVQLTAILSHAMWSEFGHIYGNRDFVKLKSLYKNAHKYSTLLALVICLSLFLVSEKIITTWSRGHIEYDAILMAVTLLYSFCASIWHVPREFLKALNRHTGLIATMLVVSFMTVVMSYLGAAYSSTLAVIFLVMSAAEVILFLTCVKRVKNGFSTNFN